MCVCACACDVRCCFHTSFLFLSLSFFFSSAPPSFFRFSSLSLLFFTCLSNRCDLLSPTITRATQPLSCPLPLRPSRLSALARVLPPPGAHLGKMVPNSPGKSPHSYPLPSAAAPLSPSSPSVPRSSLLFVLAFSKNGCCCYYYYYYHYDYYYYSFFLFFSLYFFAVLQKTE